MTGDTAGAPGDGLRDPVDFLVGYAEADRRWADWVAWQVRDAGFRTAHLGWDMVPGNREAGWLHDAVRRARHTLLVLSPDALEASDTLDQWESASCPKAAGRPCSPTAPTPCPRPRTVCGGS
jgi:hypothetical protein